MPSYEVAAAVDPLATTIKAAPFQVIVCQLSVDGKVLAVHVAPSGDVAALFDP
jgi:hypothetical protein